MPIDPRVPALVLQGFNRPFGDSRSMQQIQESQARIDVDRQRIEESKRKAATEQQLREVFTTYADDLPEAIKRGYGIDPETTSQIAERYSQAMRQAAQEHGEQIKNEYSETTRSAHMLAAARDDPDFRRILVPYLSKRDPDFAQMAPLLMSGDEATITARIDQILESTDETKNILERRAKGNELMLDGKLLRGAAMQLATVPEAERAELLKEIGPHLGRAQTAALAAMSTEQLERASLTTDQAADNAAVIRGQDVSQQTAFAGQATTAETARAGQQLTAQVQREGQQISHADRIRGQNLAAQRAAAGGGGGGYSAKVAPELATALDRATLNLPKTRREQITNLANRLGDAGDTDQLKQVIRQAAVETEPVDTRRQIEGRGNAAAALRDIRAGLRELKTAGVDTNIFRGGVEDAARALGTSTDPRLASIATRIRDSFIEYRRSLTGVAFGAAEGADYERLFPNYRNTLPLNEAILDGLERGFSSRDKEYWTRKLGPTGAVLVGALPSDTRPPGASPAAPSGGGSSRYERYRNRPGRQ